MRRVVVILLVLVGIRCSSLSADRWVSDTRLPEPDPEPTLSLRDSIRLYRKPDALRAVWMGAIIPGYGQIYNRSYWKLPVVYGAFFGCAYAITWTNGLYNDYKTAYRDIATAEVVTEDPSNSYIAILPEGYTLSRVGGASKWETTLQSRQNTYRRYRDISIVATVLVYALSLVDAYVDAQLFDFDITPDLTMTVQPDFKYDFMNNRTAELRVAIAF
ncbi:MAG: hypothetical protein IJS13_05585 [Paludibacteraceae bacterium]|nr:hypothetical protein [Paludibacteraceae bacterium]